MIFGEIGSLVNNAIIGYLAAGHHGHRLQAGISAVVDDQPASPGSDQTV